MKISMVQLFESLAEAPANIFAGTLTNIGMVHRYTICLATFLTLQNVCGYSNAWTANSAVQRLANGTTKHVHVTWHVTGDIDKIGDPRGTDISGKTPNTYKNIHIVKITYSRDDAPFDLSFPWRATWLSGGSADTTYPVIDQINATAFRDCDAILSVTIPVARQAGIAKIGMPCFLGCQNLTAIKSSGRDGDLEWSKSMCHYHTENGVLYDNTRTSLKKYPEGRQEEVFTVPSSVTNLEDYCFANTRFLKSLVFTGKVPAVGAHTFDNSSIRTVYYIRQQEEDNNRWETFEWDHRFEFRTRMLDDISEAEFSLTIEKGVVKGVNGVYPSHITIPSGVTRIGNYAFQCCAGLESVTIPSSVTRIGLGAFEGCGLTSVTIPDGVTSIEAGAFQFCSDLESVTIPASVTNIGNWAFEDCYSLERISIPGSVKTIGRSAFKRCDKLADTNGYVIVRNVLYDFVPLYVSSTTIPNGVTDISEHAFAHSYLGEVTMPNSLRRIGDNAFYYCHFLESVTIPGSVTNIGNEAFMGMPDLKSVTIGDGVLSIGHKAFRFCTNLVNVTIPDSVTSIGRMAFQWGADSLYDVTSIPGVQLVEGGAVDYTDALRGHLDLTGVRGIGACAFEDCSGITSVTIPEGIANIDIMAFRDCSELTSVTIPKSVTSIGTGAFWGCPISKMVIPANVKSIGDSVFEDCGKLRSVTLPMWCKDIMIYDRNPSSLSWDESAYILSHEPMPQFDRVSWNEYLGLKNGVKITYEDVGIGGTSSGGNAVLEMWKKAQTVDGAVFRDENAVGVIKVKIGKANKNGEVSVSGMITGLDGKKLTAKGGKVAVSGETVTATLMVKGGTLATVTVGKDGVSGSWDGAEISAAAVGGNWTKEGAKVYVNTTSAPFPSGTVAELLPNGEPVLPKGGKLAFNRPAIVRLSRDKTKVEWDTSKDRTNLSSLKLTYTARTGLFKGSFKAYALGVANGRTKLIKYTVNVLGFVVDGKGVGEARCRNPAGGPWTVTIE